MPNRGRNSHFECDICRIPRCFLFFLPVPFFFFLTGYPKREWIRDTLQQSLARAVPSPPFFFINDTLGTRRAMLQLLRQVAERLFAVVLLWNFPFSFILFSVPQARSRADRARVLLFILFLFFRADTVDSCRSVTQEL